MILAGAIVGAVVVLWLIMAAAIAARLGISFRQALLYAPLKSAYRISDASARIAKASDTPVIYVVLHQSSLEPPLMLSLLPAETLHILDEQAARSGWLEPWRDLARTIAFNPQHVFLSRRLVRHLRGKGRLAVYISNSILPDTKEFLIYRAVGRIALAADAKLVPVAVQGARHTMFSRAPATEAPRRLLGKLRVSMLEPMSVPELWDRAGEGKRTGRALFSRVSEALREG